MSKNYVFIVPINLYKLNFIKINNKNLKNIFNLFSKNKILFLEKFLNIYDL